MSFKPHLTTSYSIDNSYQSFHSQRPRYRYFLRLILGISLQMDNFQGLQNVGFIVTFLFNEHNYNIRETTTHIAYLITIVLWKPYLLKDINQLEQLYCRATK